MKRIFLNNAEGAYPLAPGVISAVTQAMENPPVFSGRNEALEEDCMRQCRGSVARLMNVSPSQVILTSGATYGLNAVISGIGLKRDDLVITTLMEHNSVLHPLANMEYLNGVRVEYVPFSAGAKLDEDAFDQLLAAGPRLVVITHASNVTGRVNPVRSLFEKAKSVGALTLLDASQTIGRIPVLPTELFADMVAFSGYKGLRGPVGTGALYVAPGMELDPVVTGAPNMPAFAGLNAALSFSMGSPAEIISKEWLITGKLLSGLMSVPKLRIIDEDLSGRLPVISFAIGGMDAEEAAFALAENFGVECRGGIHCAPLIHEAFGVPGTVRFSPSYANNLREIEQAVEAVRSIAGGL